MTTLLMAVAGGVGAAARFLTDSQVAGRVRSRLPVGTIVVNVTGSFLLALLVGWAARQAGGSSLSRVLGTGLLGGYTTFSTASVEAARLARGGREMGALVHAVSMIVLSVTVAAIGVWLTSR